MGLKIENKKLGKALFSSIIQQCYPGIRLSFSVKICDKNQNKIHDQGRILIIFSRRVSAGCEAERTPPIDCRWSKSNFKTNFLTYRIGSSWHQDIFESGMLGTDFVSFYLRHNFHSPCRNRPYLSLRYAWRNHYIHHTCRLHNDDQKIYLRRLYKEPRACVPLLLVSSARGFHDPFRGLLSNVIVKTKTMKKVIKTNSRDTRFCKIRETIFGCRCTK